MMYNKEPTRKPLTSIIETFTKQKKPPIVTPEYKKNPKSTQTNPKNPPTRPPKPKRKKTLEPEKNPRETPLTYPLNMFQCNIQQLHLLNQ
jgi:hypothetical protein